METLLWAKQVVGLVMPHKGGGSPSGMSTQDTWGSKIPTPACSPPASLSSPFDTPSPYLLNPGYLWTHKYCLCQETLRGPTSTRQVSPGQSHSLVPTSRHTHTRPIASISYSGKCLYNGLLLSWGLSLPCPCPFLRAPQRTWPLREDRNC